MTAPIYALLEGLVLGGLSALFELRYPGIAMQAVGLTFGTLFVMLLACTIGADQGDAEVSHGRGCGYGRDLVFYFLRCCWDFSGFTFHSVYGGGLIGIGFSLFVVGIAALNLVLDFDFVEQGVTGRRSQVYGVVRRPSASW